MAQLQARPTVGAGRLAGKFAARDSRATPHQLDLAAHYNVLLDEAWFGPENNHLDSLPRGLREMDGIVFDLRGAIQLASSNILGPPDRRFPRAVRDIAAILRCERLHFLHGTISGAGEGQEIGRYIVHYSDGAHVTVPIRYGREVRDYWNWSGAPQETSNAVVAWRGDNPATRERGFSLQLFRTSWENPRPEVRVATIDFMAGNADILMARNFNRTRIISFGSPSTMSNRPTSNLASSSCHRAKCVREIRNPSKPRSASSAPSTSVNRAT